jgi:hypothetical protein
MWIVFLLPALLWAEESGAPMNWNELADEGTIEIVTTNEDGTLRETTIWLLVVDGEGYIRTSNTRWGRNIDRDPDVTLRIAENEYPLRAQKVTDEELFNRLQATFRERYGFRDRLTGLIRSLIGNVRIYQMVPRPPAN